MSENNPLEDAWERTFEAFVYAPIGLVFEGPEVFPTLVEKGRNQIMMAKMMGEFAVQQGQAQAEKLIAERRSQVFSTLESTLESLGVPGFTHKPTPDGARAEQNAGADSSDAPRSKTSAPKKTAKAAGTKKKQATKRTAAPDLAIPEYDSLSASQVVTRLAGLSKAELEAVRMHEAGNRGRKTILNKISQLQS